MSIRRKVFLASALLTAALVMWFLVLPMFQYSAARKKFRLGMSLEEAQKVARKPFLALSAAGGVVYGRGTPEDPATPTPPENLKQTAILTEMHCEADGVLLMFNYYNKLVEIRPIGSLVDILIWKHTRGW